MKYLGTKSASSFLRLVLNLAWYLGIAVTVLLAMSQLYYFLIAPHSLSGPIMLQFETPGLVFRFTEGLTEPNSETLFVLQFTLVMPLLAIGLLVIYQLRKIFATLVDETPFTSNNVRRIRFSGAAVIAGTLLKALLNTLIGVYFSKVVHLPGLELNYNYKIDFIGIFLGLVILILAEVFRQGARLQEDQDLTV
ncbi:MAG: DUF2975 domain-containing protein [Bacillota bacterium]